MDDGDTLKSFCSKCNVDEKYVINWAASRHAQFIKYVDFSLKKWTISIINPVTQRALRDP